MTDPYRTPPDTPPRVFRWTVEIEVPPHVVREGFDLDDARIHDAMCRAYPVLYRDEIKARVLSAPDPTHIQEEIGT